MTNTDIPTPDQVHHWLRTIPDLHALLPTAATTRTNGPTTHTPPTSRPLINLHITHLQDTRNKWNWEWGMWQIPADRLGTLPYLHGWVRDLEATAYEHDLPVTHWPHTDHTATITACTHWLITNLQTLTTLPNWPHFATGIHTLHHQLATAVHTITHPTPTIPCTTCDNGHLTRSSPNSWTCTTCTTTVTVHPVTIPQAATITGAPRSTLYDWAKTGRLRTRILGDNNAKLYDLHEIRAAILLNQLHRDTPTNPTPNNPTPDVC